MKDRTLISHSTPPIYESYLITLERLIDGGYFQYNRKMIADSLWPSIPRFFQVICSMTNLEKLILSDQTVTLTEENIASLLQSCPKLTELQLKLSEGQELEISEELKNELRPGCQQLRFF